jgi:hypothetical protein
MKITLIEDVDANDRRSPAGQWSVAGSGAAIHRCALRAAT